MASDLVAASAALEFNPDLTSDEITNANSGGRYSLRRLIVLVSRSNNLYAKSTQSYTNRKHVASGGLL